MDAALAIRSWPVADVGADPAAAIAAAAGWPDVVLPVAPAPVAVDGAGDEASDEALCRRAGSGEAAAFDRLVDRYQERAYRIAWSILRHPEDARDASQDAFLRLHQTAASFRGESRFSTWFYRILVNAALDHRRRHRWWRRLLAGGDHGAALARVPAGLPDPAVTAGRAETARRLWQAVDGLAPRQRAAVILLVQEGLPAREVAEALGCSEATVRVHLHRAVRALRRTMEGA
jgi:RNA polymerase sigma-70 factor (ECF subfamily)